jgi:hypothetical protein
MDLDRNFSGEGMSVHVGRGRLARFLCQVQKCSLSKGTRTSDYHASDLSRSLGSGSSGRTAGAISVMKIDESSI